MKKTTNIFKICLLSLLVFLGCNDSKDASSIKESNITGENSSSQSENKSSLTQSSSISSISSEISTESISSQSSSSDECESSIELTPTVFTFVDNSNNSSLQTTVSGDTVTAYYGTNVKFGTQLIIGKWYFSNYPTDAASWERIDLEDNSTLLESHILTPVTVEKKYGISKDGKKLYIVSNNETKVINFIEEEINGCLKIEPFKVGVALNRYANYLCNSEHIIQIPDSCIEQERSDINNTGNSNFELINYDGETQKLYYGENTFFGSTPIVNNWILSSSISLSFDDESYIYTTVGSGAVGTMGIPYGVSENGLNLFVLSRTQGITDTNNSTITYRDYSEIEFISDINETCANVNVKNSIYLNDTEGYKIMCKT